MSYTATKEQTLKQSTFERLQADSSALQNMAVSWKNTLVSLREKSTLEENTDLDVEKERLVSFLTELLED